MAIAIVALTFAACGGSKNSSPEKVANAYMKCYKNLDFDGFRGVVYFEDEEELDKTIAICKEKAKDETFKKMMQIESYEQTEVEMAEDGQSAKVYFKTQKEGKESSEKVRCILVDGKWYVKM